MNVELMKEWIAALRSGEYKQTRGCLRRGDCFCANGVLADVLVKKGEGRWSGSSFFRQVDGRLFASAGSIQFHPFAHAMSDRYLPGYVEMLNDGHAMPFEQIATHLESLFPELTSEQ